MEIGCQGVRKWKKGWEPLLYTKRTRSPVGPSTSPHALENKYFASGGLEPQHPRTERTATSLLPDMSYRTSNRHAYIHNLRGQKIIPITGLVHITMDSPLPPCYLLQLNNLRCSSYHWSVS
jgi:hypothetical protein